MSHIFQFSLKLHKALCIFLLFMAASEQQTFKTQGHTVTCHLFLVPKCETW